MYSQCNCAKSFSGHSTDNVVNIEKISGGFLYSFHSGSSIDFPVQGQYILKYDNDCNLIWKKPLQHLTFTVDPSGNIYTVEQQGYYQNYEGYIRKYSPDGILVWEKMFKDARIYNNVSKRLFYYNNNIYLASNFYFGVNFEDQVVFQYPYPWISGRRAKYFIAKYTADGAFVDAEIYGDGNTDYFQDAEIDDQGNIYLVQSDPNYTSSKLLKINADLQTVKSEVIATETTHPQSLGYIPTVLYFNRFNSKLYSYGVYHRSTNLGTHLISDSTNSLQGLIVEYNTDLSISRYLKYNNNLDLQVPDDDGNNNSTTLNRSFFNANNSDEIYVFSHFSDKVNLGGTDILGSTASNGSPNIDLIYFKINLNTFMPEFIFKSVSTSPSWGANAPSKFILTDDRAFFTGNYHQKRMEINDIELVNNSGNGDSDAFLFRFDGNSNIGSLQSNSPVCVNSTINLKASGGTTFSWTGPNGFTSTEQNPTIPNASVLNAGLYSCTISGTSGCDGTFTIEVKVEDTSPPIPNLTVLPTIIGNCKTVISNLPTATDVCMGNIVATTADPLQYSLPGNYVITWKYDDGNGNISTQNQNITITSEPLPIANAAQNFCKISSPKISDLQVTGTSIKWYDSAGNTLNSNTLLSDGTKYYASQTLNGCESAKIEITVTLNDPTAPTGSAQQDFCSAQNPTIANLTVAGSGIRWYDLEGNLLPVSTPISDGETYYATQTVNGCESTTRLSVKVSVANGGVPANDYSTAFCNDTIANTKTVDLNDYNTSLIVNTAGLIFEFYDSANQLIANPANQKLNIGLNAFHVKISNKLGCFVYVKLNLTLHPKPVLNLPASAEFCAGQSLDFDASSGFSSYEWTKNGSGTPISSNQILNVTAAGIYTIKVKNSFGCENSASVTVTQSSLGTIAGVQIVNNTATVIMSNSGDFLYSLDNSVWQTSNLFTNLTNGNHTVYVQTPGGCFVDSNSFSIFSIHNIITPNEDGLNDTWKIDGIENYPNSEIKVYDRNGKIVLSKISAGRFEWNGKYDSRPLPTDNYWYVIKVSDGRILTGWLLIKNRN